VNKKKLLIIMSGADPAKPESCYTPLFQATIAAALSHEVEVVLTGISVQLAIAGMAEKVEIDLNTHQTIYDVIQEAHKAGVIFRVCNTSLRTAADELIPEIDDKVGTAYAIAEAMDENTLTFTY
jgi:predicted peroxiredoxin